MHVKKRLTFVLCLAAVAVVAVVSLRPRGVDPAAAAAGGQAKPAATNRLPEPAVPPTPKTAQVPAPAPETVAALEKLLAAPVALDRSGPLELARDELFLRQPGGGGSVVPFPPAADAGALLAQAEKVRVESGIEPELLFYPPKVPRSESNRRIATRDVLVSAGSRQEADALAKAAGLEFKTAPAYAPGRFVYTAKNSAGALAFHANANPPAGAKTTPLLAMRPQKLSAFPNDRYFQKQWHLAFQNQLGAEENTDINALSLWNYPSTDPSAYNRGQGVTIGIVDDGLEWSHPDLAPNVKKNLQYDWIGNDTDPTPDYREFDSNGKSRDPDNHGTACAGVAAACGNNHIGVSGVAPEAGLVGLRLVVDGASTTDLDTAETMSWASGEIDIKSNSWGSAIPLYPMGELTEAALEYATSFGRGGRGTVFTFSAGNSDLENDRADYSALQNSPYTICVGAVSSRGVKSDYSERGASLVVSAPSNTFYAPGLGIMTTDNRGNFGYNSGTFGYNIPGDFLVGLGNEFLGDPDVTINFGGTSSACPTVSGVIALMLRENPSLGWRDVQEILMRSAAQVDANDPEWTTANRTDHATGNKTVEFHFNHKYGAGLVDAAAAVALSANWTNLGARVSQTYTPAGALPVAVPDDDPAGATVEFQAGGPNLRVEHVALKLTVDGAPMGDLEIKLASPDGTESIFCEANNGNWWSFIEGWTFHTVRSWAEGSTGNWTLTVADRGEGQSGNITAVELTIYGTATGTGNPPPAANLAASSKWVFTGTAVTLNATAADIDENGGSGTVATLNLVQPGNQTVTGNATQTGPSAVWTWVPAAAGNFTFAVNATDSEGASRLSPPVPIRVDPPLLGGWDFETHSENQTETAAAIQSTRKYGANFGSNNGTAAWIYFDGTEGSSIWNHSNGEIWTAYGAALNLGPGFANSEAEPIGLALRGGKNLSANGKSLTFKFDMTANRRLRVSYDTAATAGGFTSQVWEYSRDGGANWVHAQTVSPPRSGFETITLNQIAGLNNVPNALLRVRFDGATNPAGTNMLDNIRFNATPTP